MKVVYVAGPFRGRDSWEIESNIRRAEALALEVWRAGAAALCPHANTRFFQGAADDGVMIGGGLIGHVCLLANTIGARNRARDPFPAACERACGMHRWPDDTPA